MTARLTVAEAAETSRRHPVTIRRALEAKVLHGTQRVVRSRWLIQLECLDAWLDNEQCEHQQSAAAVTHIAPRRAARASA